MGFDFLFYILICKYETIVSRNGLSLGYSERDTSSVWKWQVYSPYRKISVKIWNKSIKSGSNFSAGAIGSFPTSRFQTNFFSANSCPTFLFNFFQLLAMILRLIFLQIVFGKYENGLNLIENMYVVLFCFPSFLFSYWISLK